MGSAPVRFALFSLPLPQLASHWSNESWAGKRVAGKPQACGHSGTSFATQPDMGTVTTCLIPWSRLRRT